MSDKEQKHHRTIKSYVLREGRLTPGQQYALDSYWQDYGIDILDNKLLDLSDIFSNNNPVTLEIGFGDGASLIAMAKSAPKINFVGIEVYKSGVGKILHEIQYNNLTNIKVIRYDAKEVVANNIKNNSIDCVQIFFPDPWQKKRHHKRRIVSPEFVSIIANKLKVNGVLHLATDWENYAEHMQEVLSGSPSFKVLENPFSSGLVVNKRPNTKFELKGKDKGHKIVDLYYQKIST